MVQPWTQNGQRPRSLVPQILNPLSLQPPQSPQLYTLDLNPKPEILNPKPSTLNPGPSTPHDLREMIA